MMLESLLRTAVENEDFVLHYQPIVSLSTFEISGFEALVRCRMADGTLVCPDEFISTAESTGLIVQLGAWILREACRAARQLQRQFPLGRPLTMSVNVSPCQLSQTNVVACVREAVLDVGGDPLRLQLEITEGALIDGADDAITKLMEIRRLGALVSIDDFGKGNSSLSRLHDLPIDVLKIDRSFIATMNNDAKSFRMVRAIIDLAHNMGMAVTAEGIESAEQVTHLRKMGCQSAQGHYFSCPVDLPSACALLSQPLAAMNDHGDPMSQENIRLLHPPSFSPSGQGRAVDEWLRRNVSCSFEEQARYRKWLV